MPKEPSLLIVGGGSAGLAAAARFARTRPGEVLLLDQSPIIAVGTCSLPYLISGEIPHPQQLILQTPEQLSQRGVRFQLEHRVEEIDSRQHRVRVQCLRSRQTGWIPYQQLLLCPGASSHPLGAPFDNVLCPRDLLSSLKVRGYLEQPEIRQVLVVGGGYLGLELVEAVTRRGRQVTLVESGKVLLGLEAQLADRVEVELQNQGVRRLQDRVIGWEGKGNSAQAAYLAGGDKVTFDLALLATGIQPTHPLLESLPLTRGPTGGVRVDRQARTSLPGVLAAGDCCEIPTHRQSRQSHHHLPLARPATRLGQVAGAFASQRTGRYPGALECFCLRLFSLEIGWVSLGEPDTSKSRLVHWSRTRPGYWPGKFDFGLCLQTRESSTGPLVGAQVVAQEGALGRLQTLGLAIQQGLSPGDLEDLDHPYSPPLAALWDPISRSLHGGKGWKE